MRGVAADDADLDERQLILSGSRRSMAASPRSARRRVPVFTYAVLSILECGGLTPLSSLEQPKTKERKRRQTAALQNDFHWFRDGWYHSIRLSPCQQFIENIISRSSS